MSAQVVKFLMHQIGVSEFHDWFIPASWEIDAESEQVKRFAYRLQLLLAEFSNGDRTEGELRESIWDVLNPQVRILTIEVPVGDKVRVFAGDAVNALMETQVGRRSADTLSAVELESQTSPQGRR